MAFPPRFLDELRERSKLSDLIGRSLRLTRRGREFVGLCPFHQEKTPSFTVSDDKGFFHCFGCGAHGDVIGWLIQQEGLTFTEAVTRLAGECGLAVPQPSPEAAARAKRAEGLAALVAAASDWFQAQLAKPGGAEARAYLNGRGLEAAQIERFRLGFAPPGRFGLASFLQGEGYDAAALVEAGLARIPEDGGQAYDFFRGRVIFPIDDGRGRPIAFGGRSLGDGEPKYLNSPDTPLFAKGRTLYNFARARKAALKTGRLIVAEGYMDAIAFDRAGLPAAVAPLGTAITEDQLQLCWRLATEPVLCLDGDAAGRRAAFRAADRALALLKPGRSLGFVFLPAGSDPDSLLAGHGAQALAEAIDAPVPLAELVWQRECAAGELDTPERRAGLRARLMQRADNIQDSSVRTEYREMFLDRFRALGGSGRAGAGSARSGGSDPDRRRPRRRGYGDHTRPATAIGAGPGVAADRQERALLAAPLLHPALLPMVYEDLATVTLANRDFRRLQEAILDIAAENRQIDKDELLRALTGRDLERVVATVLKSPAWGGGLVEPHLRADVTLADVEAGWRETLTLVRARNSLDDARIAFGDDQQGGSGAGAVREAQGTTEAATPAGQDRPGNGEQP